MKVEKKIEKFCFLVILEIITWDLVHLEMLYISEHKSFSYVLFTTELASHFRCDRILTQRSQYYDTCTGTYVQ